MGERNLYKDFSLKLYDVLDDNGVSTDVRQTYTKMATITEIIGTVHRKEKQGVINYVFGSHYEGTSTIQMKPDLDRAFIFSWLPVVTNISECRNIPGLGGIEHFLIVPDHHAGYVKLQLVHDEVPQFRDFWFSLEMDHPAFICEADSHGRVCLVEKQILADKFPRKGLVLNYPGGKDMMPSDNVYCLNCASWPDIAAKWLTRERRHGWPSTEELETCKSLGFLLVPKGHIHSDDAEKQWRISFSRQERFLVVQFNSVQMKTYVLLKLINKEMIWPNIKEDSLSSYHCKTCMLYLIENTPSSFWIPENLAACVLMCLRQILLCVIADNCPNYFIPEENMFDRISKELKQKLEITLYMILIFCSLENLLKQIESDMIGEQLKDPEMFRHYGSESSFIFLSSESYPILPTGNLSWRQIQAKKSKLNVMIEIVISDIMLMRNPALRWLYDCDLVVSMENFRRKISKLEQLKTVTDHSEVDTKLALSLYVPFLRLHLLSQTLAEEAEKGRGNLEKKLFNEEWEQLGVADNSSKLKQAAAMLTLGYTENSEETLLPVLSTLYRHPLCNCSTNRVFPEPNHLVNWTHNRPNITVSELFHDFFQPCVVFLPSEHIITPTPINYEMIRTFGMPTMSENDKILFSWYHWAVVEGLFLGQFLLYMSHKALGKGYKSLMPDGPIDEMVSLIDDDIPMHKETSLNLLGWVYKDLGRPQKAVDCFVKSLKLQPENNAACWHLCFLICGL